KNASALTTPSIPEQKPMFVDITAKSGIDYKNQPSPFVDFKATTLLPFQLSKIGPCLAKADVNKDGLEDVFIGATSGQENVLYLQTKDGRFVRSASQPWNSNLDIDNADALFFDADGDGDQDLYLVSGGAEFISDSKNYQDRIFENDGKGNFKEVPNALPTENISSSCARAADIDKDGLPDLFIGGSFVPGRFPTTPESFILKNRSKKGRILFEKDNDIRDTAIKNIGMVTDAVWTDLNKDGWPDLIVVGQFMPIRIFENKKGKLNDATSAYGLSNTNGWWRRIIADDFDNDGNVDFMIGNVGLNTAFHASQQEPLSIIYGEFYYKGVIDPVLTYYNGGKNYPWYSKDELARAIPTIQKQFLRYEDYARATVTDIFSKEQLAKSSTVNVNMLQSIFLRNNGNHSFSIIPLPNDAQVSAINGIVVADLDKDGNKDVITSGNLYPFRVQIGPLDASLGLVLKGNGKGNFSPMVYDATGLFIDGDVRNMISVNSKNGFLLIAAKNNGSVQVVQYPDSGALP
ncbi:MAG: VCBS repeat-containing protein, partial [Bacteroidota bacterium]|nr:VCBS repeat-containing protein [Bacteroidota bacterium]